MCGIWGQQVLECSFPRVLYAYHIHFSHIQIYVVWMGPPGPGRYGHCRPMGVFAPPPLPIQVINITSIETVRVTRVSDEAQDVTLFARSASQ